MTDTDRKAAAGDGDPFTPPLSWYGVPGPAVAGGAIRLRADVFPQAVGADRVRVVFWAVDDPHTTSSRDLSSPSPVPGDSVTRRVMRLAVDGAEPGVQPRVVFHRVGDPASTIACYLEEPLRSEARRESRSGQLQNWIRVSARELEACTVGNHPVATSLPWMFDRTYGSLATPVGPPVAS